jgi:hypothetical protein
MEEKIQIILFTGKISPLDLTLPHQVCVENQVKESQEGGGIGRLIPPPERY